MFEAVVLWSLRPAIPAPALLIGLVAYRVIYFLLPLLLATGMWALHEAQLWYRRNRAAVRAS